MQQYVRNFLEEREPEIRLLLCISLYSQDIVYASRLAVRRCAGRGRDARW
jgi:hypothetical protein